MAGANICFLATSKSGLGHLRRVATIASRVRAIAPDRTLHLISNAAPKGVGPEDIAAFDTVQVSDRAGMADALPMAERMVLVLDTITVPGVERRDSPLALVLRETPKEGLHRFRLEKDRPWDQVIVANPQDHWMPDDGALATRAKTPVGWIYRSAGVRLDAAPDLPTVLVASGGGGTVETARAIYAEIDDLLLRVRLQTPRPFQVVQAIGPRASAYGQLNGADRVVDPGSRLNDLFRDADIVISTAGYNSVLELATTDTPALLVPIPRSIDDQAARARLWAAKLGAWYDATNPEAAAAWLAQEITGRRRRPPIDLGPSGEDCAARAILSLR